MKKSTLLSFIVTFSASSMAFAGAMGDAASCCSGFFSLEGGYTWNNIDGYNFLIAGTNSSFNSVEDNNGYTGRIAAGVLDMMDDQWGLTGEVGWGYYGKTSLSPFVTGLAAEIPVSTTTKHTLSGFDALVGVAFIQPYFTLSLKAGALIQNMRNETTSVYTAFSPVLDEFNLKDNTTAVLPEVKVGAAYNFDSNWALTGAYIFALGGSPKTTGVFDINTGRATLNVNTQNPTINSLLLGIQYTC